MSSGEDFHSIWTSYELRISAAVAECLAVCTLLKQPSQIVCLALYVWSEPLQGLHYHQGMYSWSVCSIRNVWLSAFCQNSHRKLYVWIRMCRLNHFRACTTAKASFFAVEYILSVFDSTLLANSCGLSSLSITLDSTAAKLTFLASVSTTNRLLKSGYWSVCDSEFQFHPFKSYLAIFVPLSTKFRMNLR